MTSPTDRLLSQRAALILTLATLATLATLVALSAAALFWAQHASWPAVVLAAAGAWASAVAFFNKVIESDRTRDVASSDRFSTRR